MTNQSDIYGNQNIVIQGVSESTIIINDNGEIKEIQKQLTELKNLLEAKNIQTFQTADKIYNIGNITHANFDFVVAQSSHSKALPSDLADDLITITDRNRWVQSLQRELIRKGVAVKNQPLQIIQHYGWLVEEFLRKVLTPEGQKKTLRALSFMTEAWQSSIRYLCYIQIAQLLNADKKIQNACLSDYINMRVATTNTNTSSIEAYFDYLNLLIVLTDLVPQNSFVPEIADFAEELSNTHNELYDTALFLEKHRIRLLNNTIAEDEQLSLLLDEYLTGLVFWLRKLAFLAKYRLVSIKNINLNYRLGTPKNFVHLYGELHGMYSEALSEEDYISKSMEDVFTYNQSVLLLKGSDVTACLNNISDPNTYLSLSPLVIDQSVFATKPTQTPEVFYYTGCTSIGSRRLYNFAQYKNELVFGEVESLSSNKTLIVKAENINQPKLNDLFEQLEHLFQPFKNPVA